MPQFKKKNDMFISPNIELAFIVHETDVFNKIGFNNANENNHDHGEENCVTNEEKTEYRS